MKVKTLREITDYYGRQLAKGAFELGAIRLSPSEPFRWASGYYMPIYNDNRQFLAKASYRALICDAFSDMIESLSLQCDGIAGTATAGIPHATSLADRLNKPLSYVRSSSKDHGLGHQIEGFGSDGSYRGARILLIEDLISTGSSSVNALEAIRRQDGLCDTCLGIFSYGLSAALDAFTHLEPSAMYHTILSYDLMIEVAKEVGYITEADGDALKEWRDDPFGWGERHGFPKEEK